MTHKVLVDEQALGWGKRNTTQIGKDYEKILMVGTPPAPPQGSDDVIIGCFCEEENCNLITGDYTAYTHLLDNTRIKTVQISKYAWDVDAKRQIYLIKII